MTTKQIAAAVGKEERTVRRWVAKASDKMSEGADKMSEGERNIRLRMRDKISSATPSRPADFSLEETLAIIETGLGKNAASVFHENAKTKSVSVNAASDPTVNAEAMFRDPYVLRGMEYVFGAIGKMEERLSSVEKKIEAVPQIGYDETHMTVLGFCKVNDITCSVYDASRAGKEAARLSREEGVEIRTVPDDRFGKVNSYHKAILSRVFAL